MASIFLSYSREDRACADRIARVLESAGHQVWWDRHIGTGREFSAEIESALDNADAVVVAWSANAVKSAWVRDEAAAGRDKGRLIPVTIDDCQPPLGFRQFQALDLAGWKGREKDPRTKALVDAVGAVVSGAPAAPVRSRIATRRPTWLWPAALAVMLLAVAGYVFMSRMDRSGGEPLKPTIALLPLSTATTDPDLRQLAAQSRDTLAHSFSQSGLPVRLLESAPNDPAAADFLISGDFSKSGQKVVANVRLDEAAHGVTVFAQRFEATPEQLRDLPERIGAQMAGNLTWASPLLIMDRRDRLDPAIMTELLQTNGFDVDPLQAYQAAKRVVAKAPNVAAGHIGVAFNTAFILDELPAGERAQAVAEARRSADIALKLKPKFGDSYAPWCYLRSETHLAACEDRLRAGRRADPDAPFLNTFLSHLMRNVGRIDEAMDLAKLAYTHDIYSPTKIAWMLKSLEYSGDYDDARTLFEQALRWWPDFRPMFFRNRMFGLIDRGDFDAMAKMEAEVGPANLPQGYQSSAPLASAIKAHSASAAHRVCARSEVLLLDLRCMLALATVGDTSGAFAIADRLYPRRLGPTEAETERIWLDDPFGITPLEFITSPATAPMRRDPRFLPLVERTGLLAYWRSGRPPDFCRKNPEPVCAKLLGKG